MNSFDNQLSEMVEYDLTSGFSNLSISDAGELDVPKSFQHPLYLRVGQDVLMLTMFHDEIAFATGGSQAQAVTGYMLENLTAGSTGASILFDNERVAIDSSPDDARFKLTGGKVLTLGRDPDATPELRLSEAASRKHAIIRTGNMQGNLHFVDMDSTNGTSVFIHPDDAKLLQPPRRTLVFIHGELRLATDVEQRWFRREFEKEVILVEATASNSR